MPLQSLVEIGDGATPKNGRRFQTLHIRSALVARLDAFGRKHGIEIRLEPSARAQLVLAEHVKSSGGDGGWLTGSAITAMAEDTEGADANANAAAPTHHGALTAGLAKLKKRTVLRGVTKRKNKAIARGIAHADRKEVKAKKKVARRGLRLEGKQLY